MRALPRSSATAGILSALLCAGALMAVSPALAAEPDGSSDGSGDAQGESDDTSSTGTGAVECVGFSPDAPWIDSYTSDLVARLSGAAELSPGVTLFDRATPERRDAVRDALVGELSALGLSPQLHTYDASGANVWVPIDATEPTRSVVVFGAHFDTVPGSPGANDNATGVALAMALARFLSELPCRNVNVIVVFFDQEEIGLVGSDAFAAFLVQQGLAVDHVQTVDQMGWDGDGDRAVELERADPGLFGLYDAASAALPSPVPLTPTDTGATDHVSFRAYGFDAVGLTEEYASGDTTPHYHAPSDTFDTVDTDYLRSTTMLVLQVFGELTVVP